jgi:hypothetical protein
VKQKLKGGEPDGEASIAEKLRGLFFIHTYIDSKYSPSLLFSNTFNLRGIFKKLSAWARMLGSMLNSISSSGHGEAPFAFLPQPRQGAWESKMRASRLVVWEWGLF